MEKLFAVIENNKVVNIIVGVEPEVVTANPGKYVEYTDGWDYNNGIDGGTFFPVPVESQLMTKARDLANASTALSAVSATELGYLDGVTSAVQTQLNAKQPTVTNVSDTEIGYLDGVTSAIQTQIDSKAASSTLTTHTGASTGVHGVTGAVVGTTDTQTLSAKSLTGPMETVQIVGALGGTNAVYAKNYGFAYSNTAATGNITLNISGDGSTTFNNWLATNGSYTLSLLVTMGTTAYIVSALQIDGTGQTIKWSGGTAPSAGNASSVDAYSFTIVKTASATYTVFGAGPIKYA